MDRMVRRGLGISGSMRMRVGEGKGRRERSGGGVFCTRSGACLKTLSQRRIELE